jgi:hypothetical protein
MKKEFAKNLFSFVFLLVFFVKMVISIAPLIANQIDNKIVNAVIMQLEIETNASKGLDQAKDTLAKSEWLNGFYKFSFSRPDSIFAMNTYILMQSYQIQAFYPTIPTPPPNS